MPPAIGTGEPAPVDPSADPRAAAALATYERFLDAVTRAPWRYGREDRAEAERRAATLEGREAAAWALPPAERWALERLVPDPERRAAIEADAAAFRGGLEREPSAWAQYVGGSSLDTWEHLDTSNSGDGPSPTPARAGEVRSGPQGHASPEAPGVASAGAERVRRYDRAKGELGPAIRAAAGVLAIEDPDAPGPAMLDRMADRVEGCRDVRAFRDAGCGAVWARPFSCDVRLCPDCERSRAAAYLRRVDGLAASMRRPLFGTGTLPNVPPGMLGLGVDVVLDAWARIRRTALFVGGPCKASHQDPDDRPDAAGAMPPHRERCRHAPHRAPASRACRSCGRRKASHVDGCAFDPRSCSCARCMRGGRGCRRCTHAPVLGGVASLEVTYSPERGDWHPHLHFVADSPFLPWREFRDAWRAATCDATRAAFERGGWSGRAAGYKAPERRERVARSSCRHLADAEGRPADRACVAGHGWRARDGERCPYQDRTMDAPCGRPGDPIPGPERCRGASMTWLQVPTAKPGSSAGQTAVREAIKYATKGIIGKDGAIAAPIRADPSLLAELLLVLRNRRLVTGWGTFHGATDDATDEDAPELVALDVGEVFPVKVPRLCPACGQEGLWDSLGIRRRVDCVPGAGGRLYWRGPPPGRADS